MKILFTADWHLDLQNLKYTGQAVEWLRLYAEAWRDRGEPFDVFVHGGDLAVNRGLIHPEAVRALRESICGIAWAVQRTHVVAGNHDLSFHSARASTAAAIFAEEHTVDVESHIRSKIYGDVGLVFVPTPDKFHLHAMRQSEDTPDGRTVEELLTAAVQGAILEAREGADKVIVFYHGTVKGAKLGAEREMPRGVDVALPHEAFAHADLVLAGHIHNPHTLFSDIQDVAADALAHRPVSVAPPIVYSGPLQPLTWNEAHVEPRVLVLDTETLDVESVALPLYSRMIEEAVDFEDDNEDVDARACVRAVVESLIDGCASDLEMPRIRLKVKAPDRLLQQLDAEFQADVETSLGLTSFKIIPEETGIRRPLIRSDETFTLEAVFHEYLEDNDVPVGEASELIALFQKIEEQVEDLHLDARYEMKPVLVTATNWCQYEDVYFEFSDLGNVTAITGRNTVGKSNLLRLILFALYKKQVSGRVLADLVREGEKTATVEFEFDTGGKRLSVVRHLKVASDGSTAAQLFLTQKMPDGSWQPVVEGDARRTQQELETLIGPLDLFLATTFAGQGDVADLLDLTPAELKDLLLGVLQRNFEGRLQVARDQRRDIANQRVQEETRQKTFTEEIAELGAAGEVLAEWQERLQRRKETVDSMPYRSLKTAIEDNLQGLLERRGELRVRKEGQRQLQERVDGLAAQEGVQTSLVTEAAAAKRGLTDEADPPWIDVAPLQEAADQTAGRLQAVRIERDMIKEALDAEVDKLAGTSSRADRDVTLQGDKVLSAGDALTFHQQQAELLDEVPCEGEVWWQDAGDHENPSEDSRDMGACPLLKSAKDSRDLLPAAGKEIADAREALNEKDKVARAAQTGLEEAISGRDQEVGDWNGKVDDAEANAGDARAALDEAHAANAKNRQRQEEFKETRRLAAKLDGRTVELQRIVRELAELRVEVKAGEGIDSEVKDTDRLIEKKKRELADLEEEKRRADNALQVAQQEVERHGYQLKRKDDLDAKVAACRRSLATLERRDKRLAFYERAMHRDGLPFLLLEQYAIPRLQTATNRYLDGADFRVAIRSDRELVGGDLRAAVEITFRDHRGQHHTSAASGQQRTRLSMALRTGIADLHAEATGSRIWLAVQDEGFGTMDAENLEEAKRAVRAIAENRGWFLYVSHLPGMDEAADSVIGVRDYNGISAFSIATDVEAEEVTGDE